VRKAYIDAISRARKKATEVATAAYAKKKRNLSSKKSYIKKTNPNSQRYQQAVEEYAAFVAKKDSFMKELIDQEIENIMSKYSARRRTTGTATSAARTGTAFRPLANTTTTAAERQIAVAAMTLEQKHQFANKIVDEIRLQNQNLKEINDTLKENTTTIRGSLDRLHEWLSTVNNAEDTENLHSNHSE
jgi:hypothetical protein